MLRYLDNPDKDLPPDQESELQEEDLTSMPTEELTEAEGLFREEGDDTQSGMLKEKIRGLEHRIGYLERIVKVSQMLNSTLSLEPLLQIIIQSATELTNTESCSIMLLDKNTGELRFAEATGGITEALRKVTVPLDGSIGGYVIRKNRPLLIRDVRNDGAAGRGERAEPHSGAGGQRAPLYQDR